MKFKKKLQIADSSPNKLNCLNISRKFLKECITNTNDVVSKCFSEFIFNLDEFFSSNSENAQVKQVIGNPGTDHYPVSHLGLGNLNHQASLATNPCIRQLLTLYSDNF